jgi:hypothetical protein
MMRIGHNSRQQCDNTVADCKYNFPESSIEIGKTLNIEPIIGKQWPFPAVENNLRQKIDNNTNIRHIVHKFGAAKQRTEHENKT